MNNSKKRKLIDLCKGWDFYLETLESKSTSSYTPLNFRNISNKKAVTLPHDWSIEQDFTTSFSAKNESGSLPGGIGWYTKTLSANDTKDFCGKNVILSFGGIYMYSFIYINAEEVASNYYGYNSFDVNISRFFKKNQDIEITVLVINRLPNSRWYSGSGIYRKAFLTVTEPVFIEPNGIYITTKDLKNCYNKSAHVNVQYQITNSFDKSINVIVKNEVRDKSGKIVSFSQSGNILISPNAHYCGDMVLQVKSPSLWSTQSPVLYTVHTTLIGNDLVFDDVETYFGFRWIEYHKEKGFILNGIPTKLKGVCLHHDQGGLGAKAYTQSIQRQLEIMKEMGANAVRTAHNPASKEFIEMCSKMGLLVIEESFDTWNGAKNKYDFSKIFNKKLKGSCLNLYGASKVTWAEFIIKSMILRDRNEPCIIMWSLGNEIQGSNTKRMSKALSKYAQKADPYLLSGRKKIYAEDDIRAGFDRKSANTIYGFSAHDKDKNKISIAGVNYIDNGTFEKMHVKYPNILMLSTESSSALRSRGEYFHPYVIKNDYLTNTKATENSQMSSYDNEAAQWANTAMFDWEYDISLDYVLGEFVWTGFDYLGEPTPFTDNAKSFYPACSYFGITDTAGFEKDIYYFYQSQWKKADEKSVLHLLPSWNLNDDSLTDGKALIVAYTNANAVELRAKKSESDEKYISFGIRHFKSKKSSSDLREYQVNSDDNALYPMALEWLVPYSEYKDYTVYAVAVDINGTNDNRFDNSYGRKQLKAFSQAKKIQLSRYNFRYNLWEENYILHFITVDMIDKNGIIDENYNDEVNFSVTGGEIIAVDNGNSCDTDPSKYSKTEKINCFHGKALVVIKSEKEQEITLKAVSGSLECKRSFK